MQRPHEDEVALDVYLSSRHGPSLNASTSSTPIGAGTPRLRSSPSPEPYDVITIPLMGAPLPPRAKGGRILEGIAAGRRGAASAGLPLNKIRSSRLRWAVILTLLVAVIMWQPKSPNDRQSAIDTDYFADSQDFVDDEPAVPYARPLPGFDAHPPIPLRPPPMPPPPQVPAHEPVAAIVGPPVVHPADATQLDAAAPAAGLPATDSRGPIDIDIHSPSPKTASAPPSHPANDRYLTYSPHSGYHNQRISLENALTLAFMLDRTLLVPPVWLGHALPYISFDKLQRRLEMANKDGLEHCIPFGDGSNEDPIPHECDDYWDWTVADWSFLVDLSEAEKLVPIRKRSSISLSWLEDDIGLSSPGKDGARSDVYELKDETMYQYRFYDSRDDLDPLEKWGNRIDIEQFRAETDAFKLVHVGSLFGTSRLRVTLDKNADARTVFRRSMVFRTNAVDEVVEQIRDQLGGPGKYHGLHLRVGDGVFLQDAKKNMEEVWHKLCVDKMKMDRSACEELQSLGGPDTAADKLHRRAVDAGVEVSPLAKRANSRPQREGAYHHAPLPPLPTIRTLADSPIALSLSCRGALHTEERFLPFNAPLFVATDSKLPRSDPNLSTFFAAFPCAFILSDFSSLPALETLNRLRAEGDKTPLAQFLYPQLDAQIAAWGRTLVGTPQSTYSRFASDVLHQVYHGWEIIERG
ncbi:hypothetical protein JCM10908_002740 [Rhodotorula pacifica]|uniref:uncharacterized protein n=1 Tax=Rhodotorula pacifica TaxID=1495444 RepID=UPI0031779796